MFDAIYANAMRLRIASQRFQIFDKIEFYRIDIFFVKFCCFKSIVIHFMNKNNYGFEGLAATSENGLNGYELGKLIRWMKSSNSSLFIHGNGVDTLALIHRLLTNGIDAGRITLGIEKSLHNLFDLGDPDDRKNVEFGPELEAIAEFINVPLQESGIDFVDNVSNMEILGAQPSTGTIGAVMVNGQHEYECDALVDLATRSVDNSIFKTLNNACLVYDGALIVDTNFCTSNEFIMAAGPMTKVN